MDFFGTRTAPTGVPVRSGMSALDNQLKGLYVTAGSPMAAGSPTQLLEQLFAANQSLQASSKSRAQELEAHAARAAATSAFADTAAAVGGSAATPLSTPIPLPQYEEAHLFACDGDALGLTEVMEDFEDQRPLANGDESISPFAHADHLGNTPLHYAAEGSRGMSAVRVLLDNGAPVDAQNFEGKTGLHLAASNPDNYHIVELLIKCGANANIADADGAMALHAAAANGCTDLCQLLLSAGAWVDAVDSEGDTPLMYAVREDLEDVVSVLVAAGANPHLQNEDGESPLDLAELSTPAVLAALR